jgi:hypothetical protein
MPMVRTILVLSLLGCLALAQEPPQQGLNKAQRPQASAQGSGAPVTQAEARAVFERAERIIREITKSEATVAPIALPAATAPLTRQQAINEFARLYEVTRPKFKLTPRAVRVDEKVLKASDAVVRARLSQLVRAGAVANYGPLAAGPAETMTVQEFGDALGFFLARMAEMTHMPSPRWSPPLMGG